MKYVAITRVKENLITPVHGLLEDNKYDLMRIVNILFSYMAMGGLFFPF